jgi:hypothetical protein
MFKKITKTRNFRIGLGVFLFACCGLSYMNGSQLREERATETHIAKFTEVVIAVSEQAAGTQTAIAIPTEAPSATPFDTPIPLPTNTLSPTNIPPTATIQPSAAPATNAPAQTYYVTSLANIRPCPRAADDCLPIRQLTSGATIQVVAEEQGGAVNDSTIWYRLDDGNYVHSGVVSPFPPAQSQQSGGSSGVTTGGGVQATQPIQPRTCATALALGYNAQQAAQAGLDNDGDGEACYGN